MAEGGRSLTLLMLQQLVDAGTYRFQVRELLARFVTEHSGCLLPNLDGQSIDMSLALLALIAEGDLESSKAVLLNATTYFNVAVRSGNWLPVDTDMIEDAVSLQEGKVNPQAYFRTSTLFPMLGTFAAVLGEQDCLGQLNEMAVSKLKDVTLERWYPSLALETLTGSGKCFSNIGISRAVAKLHSSPADEQAASAKAPDGAAGTEEFKWANSPFEVLSAVSARFYRHPVPVGYLIKYAAPSMAAAAKESESAAAG